MSRTSRPVSRFVLAGAVLCLLAADSAAMAHRLATPGVPLSVAAELRTLHESDRAAKRRASERDEAIRRLFDARAKAIQHRDHAAFVAGLDPEATAFRARQDVVFASLGRLDFATWSYTPRVDDSYRPTTIDWRRYVGADDIWLPVITLHYQLAGFDKLPVGRRVVYTVVRRGKQWYVAEDRDLDAVSSSGTSVRVDPWENGEITVARGRHGLVIGHPDDKAALAGILREIESAVAHVSRYVGGSWNQRVVVVLPTDKDELDRVLENPDVPFDFAAIARPLATQPDDVSEGDIAGSRVVINPDGFHVGDAFTRILIRHELTHVATFDRNGPLSPKWLVEGLAEYVGNAGSTLPTATIGGALGALVDKSGVPHHLPLDSDFGVIADAGIGYNSAWLMCRFIASRYGRPALLRFYDEMGSTRLVDRPGDKLGDALRRALRTDEETLLREWRPYVRAAVGSLTTALAPPGAPYREVDTGHLDPHGVAASIDLPFAKVAAAGVERAADGIWYDGDAKAPRRRVLESIVVASDDAAAARTEALLASRYTSFDNGTAIPNGRLYVVGIGVNGRHYNAGVAIMRSGILVVEVRVAVLGSGDPAAETRALAGRAYAAATTV